MHHVSLRCDACGADHAPDMKTLECRDCGGPLDAEYTAQGASLDVAGYAAAMPFSDAGSMPTLGEGGTPVVGLAEMGRALGLERFDAKLEYMNPTGSYKDRGTVVMLAVAHELGVREVVEDSSGNAGASVAAYSARAGIKAHIFAPATAPAAKLRQIRVYGAEVHSIEGPREAATDAAVAFCNENDLVYASHAWSPFFFEGTKTFAFETARHYGGEPPAHIVFPVGNGGLFLGAWRGFEELLAARAHRQDAEATRGAGRERHAHRRRVHGPRMGEGGHAADYGGRHIGCGPGARRPGRRRHPQGERSCGRRRRGRDIGDAACPRPRRGHIRGADLGGSLRRDSTAHGGRRHSARRIRARARDRVRPKG